MKVAKTNISGDSKSEGVKVSPQNKAQTVSFEKQLKVENIKILDGDLETLINKVKAEGDKFVKSPDEKNLASYKAMVKSFLNKITKSFLALKEEFGASQDGEQKVFQIVKKTEANIDELTKETLTENKALSLLGSLDDIKGLVLDILG